MLGGEQSGHIEAIGFEMYTSMLEEAVRKLKGEEDKPAHANTVLNLGISVRIDSDYIPEENQRLRMYKRIAGAQTHADLAEVRDELQDRYGTPPESVINLLAAGELRLRCEQLGIAQLDRKRTQVELPNPNGNKKQPIKTFVEMLHLKFADPLSGGAPATAPGETPARQPGIDPGVLMRLVSRNTKRGAQFSPQGVLRWPIPSAKAEDVLSETRALLDSLSPPSAA
jgi:transcription-repair coupling factor (superfamily II helicase)